MAFEKGKPVFVKQDNDEVPATFDGYITDIDGKDSSAYVLVNGKREQVEAKNLLAPKKPGFGIRDLVLINDEHREAIQGEIIAIGHGPKGQHFYPQCPLSTNGTSPAQLTPALAPLTPA